MEYKHIKDIDFKANVNSRVFGIFLAKDVEVRLQKDGTTKYIKFNMCDRGVIIEASKFGAKEEDIEKLKSGRVFYAAIDIKPYAKASNGLSCVLYNYDHYDENPANFIEWADGMTEAQQIIQETLNELSTSIYKDICSNLITQNWQSFCCWSAATGMHHNMMGGLLVHTSEVIQGCKDIATFWEAKYGPNFINRPLMLAGALLHDIGKIKELNVDTNTGEIAYSTEAALNTHITMGVSMLDIEAYKLQFGYQTVDASGQPLKTEEQVIKEKEALDVLKHVIFAHHGCKEWGSPVDMNTPEALIINTADKLSSEMFRYNKNFKDMEPTTSTTSWLSGTLVVTYKDSTK